MYPLKFEVKITNGEQTNAQTGLKDRVAEETVLIENIPMSIEAEQNFFTALPEDIVHSRILRYLNEADKSPLVSSCRAMHGFLQPSRMLNALLRSVVTGNQDRVIEILRSYPQMVVSHGVVMDNSRRTFPKASATELVRWCGDLRMANAMLDTIIDLPNKTLAEKIRAKWIKQDNAYDSNGGIYSVLPGKKPIRSLAFSLTPLLNELQAYITNYPVMTKPQRLTEWNTKVGGEQFLLTAIYLQYYCNLDFPFFLTSSIDKPIFQRNLEIYNFITSTRQRVWGGVNEAGVLGQDFAIERGTYNECGIHRGARGGVWAPKPQSANSDLQALQVCQRKSAEDLIAFKQKLQGSLNLQPDVNERPSHYCSIS